jgi:anthranilate synthase
MSGTAPGKPTIMDKSSVISMHDILQLKQLWEEHGWLGEKATRFGSPDCILLHSGGPATHLSTFSLLCGPSRIRAIVRQPENEFRPQPHPDGQFSIQEIDSTIFLEIEEWKHGAWYHLRKHQLDSIGSAMIELKHYSPTTLFDRAPHPKLPSQPFWVSALSYDLVQWTQPIEFQHRPDARTILACFYLVEQGCVYNCLEQNLTVFKIPSSDWNPSIATFEKTKDALEPFRQMAFTTRLHEQEYLKRIENVQQNIVKGDVYQVNIGQVWRGELQHEPWDTFCLLDEINPSPYSAFFEMKDEGMALVSSSPECLLESSDGFIQTSPIKGTIHTGKDELENEKSRMVLLNDEKERAEHRMLVDLMRNDLGQVCEAGSVRVERFDIEQYASVQHLVSRISGKLQQDISPSKIIDSIFPGGSITGCPRTMVCHIINQIEQGPRSFWTGSIGWFDPYSSNACWNILIRTIESWIDGKKWIGSIAAGGGITISSNPVAEVKESLQKAKPLLHAAGWVENDASPVQQSIKIFTLPKERNWIKSNAYVGNVISDISQNKADVLFIDNLDSFSMNIVHSLTTKGYEVQIIHARFPPFCLMDEAEIFDWLTNHSSSYIVIGPGPGRPEDVPFTFHLAKLAVDGKLRQSVLGVCLGHQALGLQDGFNLIESEYGPVHGRPVDIHHHEFGLFNNLKSPWKFTRYNSLVLIPKKENSFSITSNDVNGEIMSIRHNELSVFGIQFHPESVGSQQGDLIFSNFFNHHRIVEE